MINKIRLSIQCLIVLLLATGSYFQLNAQNIASTLELKELKISNDSRVFDVKLTGESEAGVLPVHEAKIEFFAISDDKSVLIGTATTNLEGKASLKLEKETKYLTNKDGVSEVKAKFTGKGQLSSAEASVKFKELSFSIALSEKDSTNILTLHASALGPKGEAVPLKETNFNIYVQGLYSKLKVGECFVDAGEGIFEFPKNIPGDENGNLKIFARLEENEEYGEIEKIEEAKWGNHRSGFVEPTRSLWTTGAPIWMITTLIILLAGVWSHYIYAIVQLVKIKKESKEIE